MSNDIRARNLLEASLSGDINLLKEMKKINGGNKCDVNLPECVEDAVGQEGIVDKFKEVYSSLYNSAESSEAVRGIKDKIEDMIGPGSITEVDKVTESCSEDESW